MSLKSLFKKKKGDREPLFSDPSEISESTSEPSPYLFFEFLNDVYVDEINLSHAIRKWSQKSITTEIRSGARFYKWLDIVSFVVIHYASYEEAIQDSWVGRCPEVPTDDGIATKWSGSFFAMEYVMEWHLTHNQWIVQAYNDDQLDTLEASFQAYAPCYLPLFLAFLERIKQKST